MKKYLPFVILGVGVLVFVVAIFLKLRSSKETGSSTEDESQLIELKLTEKPVVTLTPTEDGHYLNLKITKLKVAGAVYMDFQFLYDVPDKVQQGSTGDNIDITSGSFETDLLLGSESAGKFRYDEGVEKGNLMIWLRDSNKKLVTKLDTDFHMQTKLDEVVSIDGIFKYKPENFKSIFIVMNTLGIPDGYSFETDKIVGPYGVFSATDDDGVADVGKDNLYVNNGTWVKSNKGLGVYIATD